MKKEKNASKKTLEIINKKQIKPIPAWEFTIKNWLIWLACFFSIFVGALAFSVSIYMTQSNDWDLYYFPYFWLGIIIILTTTSYISYRKTKKGYKLEFLKLLGIVLGLSLVIGLTFSAFNIGQKIDTLLANDIPIYRQIAPMKYQIWIQPEQGMLAGKIISVNDNYLEIIDFNGKRWQIKIGPQTTIKMRVSLINGTEIKILGKKIDEPTFTAEEIRPWLNRFGN